MSEIRVDTISEKTSANGVSIDGLTIKDGGITATTGAIVFNEASADVDFRVESNGNANMLFVDGGNDRVGVGTNAPTKTLGIGGDGLMSLEGSSNALTFYDSSALKAYITSQSFGDHNGDGLGLVTAGDEPIKFFANGALQWTIETTGHLIPGANDHGIYLGVSSATASNLLDDYEEGVTGNLTLTPASAGSISVASGFRKLAYTKVGRVVHITGLLKMGSGDAAGNVTFPLPFALADTSDRAEITRGFGYLVNARAANSAGGICFIDVQTAGATTALIVKGTNTANGGKDFNATDIADSGTELSVNFSYLAA